MVILSFIISSILLQNIEENSERQHPRMIALAVKSNDLDHPALKIHRRTKSTDSVKEIASRLTDHFGSIPLRWESRLDRILNHELVKADSSLSFTASEVLDVQEVDGKVVTYLRDKKIHMARSEYGEVGPFGISDRIFACQVDDKTCFVDLSIFEIIVQRDDELLWKQDLYWLLSRGETMRYTRVDLRGKDGNIVLWTYEFGVVCVLTLNLKSGLVEDFWTSELLMR